MYYSYWPWWVGVKLFGMWWDVNGSFLDAADLDMIELGFRWEV